MLTKIAPRFSGYATLTADVADAPSLAHEAIELQKTRVSSGLL